jgi:hypothetical protein
MPLEELEATLRPLLLAWKRDGSVRSSFGDFVHKLGEERVQALLSGA